MREPQDAGHLHPLSTPVTLASGLLGVASVEVDASLISKAALWGGAAYASVVCTGLLYGSRWVADVPVMLDALGVPSIVLANAMAGAVLGLGLHLGHSDPGEDPLASHLTPSIRERHVADARLLE